MAEFQKFLDSNLLEIIENLKTKKLSLKKIIRKRFQAILYSYLGICFLLLIFSFAIAFSFVFLSFPFIFLFYSNNFTIYRKEKSFRKIWSSNIGDKEGEDYYELFPKISAEIDKKIDLYKLECKQSLFEPIIGTIIEDVEYFPKKFFNYKKVIESQLFPGLPSELPVNKRSKDREIIFKGDDAIQGYFEKKYIEFCELDISEKYKNGNDEYRTSEIFHGLFLIADFKKTQFKTIVAAELFKDFINRDKNVLKKIKLQNYTFNKHFSVFGQDEIETRKILSPIILENLGNFAEKHNRSIKFSFINDQVFFAIGIGSILEPSLKDLLPFKEIDKNSLEKDANKIFKEISFVSSIIKLLRLNSHISSN